MKRLSLLTLTILLNLGCQRSEANPVDAAPHATGSSSSNFARLTACYDADEWTCEVEAAIVRLTNEKRKSVGRRLESLDQSFESSFVARSHSAKMGASGIVDHDGFLTGGRTEVLKKEFPDLKIAYRAENVAYMQNSMVDPQEIAQEFVSMWWKSPGHRGNMEGGYMYIGVGVVRTDENRIYATQIFY